MVISLVIKQKHPFIDCPHLQCRSPQTCTRHGRCFRGWCLYWTSCARIQRSSQDQISNGTWNCNWLGRYGTNMELGICGGIGHIKRGGTLFFLLCKLVLESLWHQHPVLLTEAPLNPRSNRDVAAQIFFDTFNVPALFTSVQAVLSLYVSMYPLIYMWFPCYYHQVFIRTDNRYCIGFWRWCHPRRPSVRRILYASCHSSCWCGRKVWDLSHFISTLSQWHRDVTDHLQLLLRKSGNHLHTTAELEVVRTIKEKCCYVALNPSKEEKDSVGRSEEFRLPDGNVIHVCSSLSFWVTILCNYF